MEMLAVVSYIMKGKCMPGNLCVGLFGTCGRSKWRDPFMTKYDELGINYYNPVVENWIPEFAQVEAEHLVNDRVILFPITRETYSMGSLVETGYSILQAIRLDDRRQFVIMVEQGLEEDLMKNEIVAKESLRARALVTQHLKKLKLSNVYIVDSLKKMLKISIELYEAEKKFAELRELVV